MVEHLVQRELTFSLAKQSLTNAARALALLALAAVASAADGGDRFFDSDGVRIYYLDEGQGPPIVLIHGYLGTAERHWSDTGVIGALGIDHRVLALDCRGHGRSDKPATPAAYGRAMGEDVIRLLDHARIERAHIVGFSMGAMVAGYLLANHADRLSTVTLVAHPPVYRWTVEDERAAEAWARDLESKTPFRALIVAAPKPKPLAEHEIVALSRRLAAAHDTKALAAYHRGRRSLAVTPAQLTAATVPTLAIIGSEDPSVEAMRELKRLIPAVKLVVVDAATHGGDRSILRHAEFHAALRAFLPKGSASRAHEYGRGDCSGQ